MNIYINNNRFILLQALKSIGCFPSNCKNLNAINGNFFTSPRHCLNALISLYLLSFGKYRGRQIKRTSI